MSKDTNTNEKVKKQSFLQVMLSTIAAAFGVQSKANQERDFEQGNIYSYIAAGIIFTVVFVITVALLVKLVLKSNGL